MNQNINPFRRFVCNNLARNLVKTLRADKIDVFRGGLEFDVFDAFNAEQQTLTKTIKEIFEGEDIQIEYSVLSSRTDFYFHKYKISIEVDEFGHTDRNIDNEIDRQKQ